MNIRYERLSAIESGTKPRRGAAWERISERQLGRILTPTEIRVNLPGGRVIKTITSWYRAVVAPTLAEMQDSRVTLRDADGVCRGWGYAGLPFYIETGVDADSGSLLLLLRGPYVRCEQCVFHFVDLPRVERRIYRLATKRGLFQRLTLH